MVYHRILHIIPCANSKTLLFTRSTYNRSDCKSQTSDALLPHLPSCLATTSLISMFSSLFLFHRYVHLCQMLNFTDKQYQMAFTFLFLTSFCLIISMSIPVTVNGISSLSQWLSSIPLYTCTASFLPIHLLMEISVVYTS